MHFFSLSRTCIVLAVVGLAILPIFVQDSYSHHLLILAILYVVAASNWGLSLGYGGLFNFAHVAIFVVGLDGYGILAKTLGVSPWLAVPLSDMVAMIVSLPILRLSGIYIILVTFAFSQLILQFVVSQSDITGGVMGIFGLPPLKFSWHNFVHDGKFGYYYGALIILICSTVFLRRLVRSYTGLAIIALRDNADYAISRGISPLRQRVIALVASALFTGIAGAYFGAYIRVAAPDIFGLETLTLILSILLLGGTSTIYGPIFAAFLLTFMSEAMINLGPWRLARRKRP